jgi:hypothetical protein
MKILLVLAIGVLLTLLSAIIATPFMFYGWNVGVINALSWTHEVSWSSAFGLSLFICGVIGAARTSLTVSMKD